MRELKSNHVSIREPRRQAVTQSPTLPANVTTIDAEKPANKKML